MIQPDGCEGSQNTKEPKAARSTLVSRNVTVASHRTSVRLEPEMWSGLGEICRRERATLHEVCTAVAARKPDNTSLTAAIRVFAMAYFRAAATEDGHTKAGHGYGVAVGMNSHNAMPKSAPGPHGAADGHSISLMANGKLGNGSQRF